MVLYTYGPTQLWSYVLMAIYSYGLHIIALYRYGRYGYGLRHPPWRERRVPRECRLPLLARLNSYGLYS